MEQPGSWKILSRRNVFVNGVSVSKWNLSYYIIIIIIIIIIIDTGKKLKIPQSMIHVQTILNPRLTK